MAVRNASRIERYVFCNLRCVLGGSAVPIQSVTGFRRVYRALRIFRQRHFRRGSIYTANRFAQVVVATRKYVQIESKAEANA